MLRQVKEHNTYMTAADLERLAAISQLNGRIMQVMLPDR